MTVRHFFRTPKGLLTIVLILLAAIAAPHEGIRTIAPGLLSAVAVAAALDLLILRSRHTRWEFPSGAVLTALIIVMVLSAQTPWYVVTLTSAFAILTKYLVRTRAGNVFNPAALAIVATFPVFHAGQSWWGALPEVAPAVQAALVVTGVFIADRVNKMPLVLAFLAIYYSLFTLTSFVSDPAWVSEVFRTPDLQAVLFFALFILTDPPTSPVRYRDQLVFAVIVAVVSYAVFEWIGAVYYLLAGVLVANVWEAWRRVQRRAGQTFPDGIAVFVREVSPWRARR
ncbi:MAG TPA: RnfABCDGE type electron transport complex subunit D [Vicinamibacterales bacterium]|jgi:Na+-translocating ferredoxin:NAD+ oxidoreductase RnfD subunit|nr:RnfABCDGE type electron transport complex subunit D [Vicinamibacterales bacterium]